MAAESDNGNFAESAFEKVVYLGILKVALKADPQVVSMALH